jgi:hypothetical protein
MTSGRRSRRARSPHLASPRRSSLAWAPCAARSARRARRRRGSRRRARESLRKSEMPIGADTAELTRTRRETRSRMRSGNPPPPQSPFRWRSAVESRRGFFLERFFSRFSMKNPSRNPNSHPRVASRTFPRACQHDTSPSPPGSHASRVLDRPPVALRRRRAAFAPRSKTIARKAVTAGSGRSRAATR